MCYHPIQVKDKDGNPVNAACGKCENCHKRYIREWIFRAMQEAKSDKYVGSLFVTLTYDYDNLPLHKGKPTLVKQHLQLFFKRLRKNLKGRYIKYIAVGEYGSERSRPHYHAIIFGVIKDDYNVILKSWGMGFVHVGEVEPPSVAYTYKYQIKDQLLGQVWDWRQLPPFKVQSNGIGMEFAFDKVDSSTTFINKYGTSVTRKITKHKPNAYFQKKLQELVKMPYWNIRQGSHNVKMAVPRHFLRVANYDTEELTAMYQQRAYNMLMDRDDDKYYKYMPNMVRQIDDLPRSWEVKKKSIAKSKKI